MAEYYPSPPPVGAPGPEPRPAPASPAAPAPAGPQSADGRWAWDGVEWRPLSSATPAWLAPYASPRARAIVTITGLALEAALYTAIAMLTALARVGVVSLATLNIDASVLLTPIVVVLTLNTLLVLAGTPALLAWWTVRCCRNLPVLGGRGLRWSPGWAACGWFVPLAGFAIPYLVLREVWSSSGRSGRPPVVLHVWVLAWIVRVVVIGGGELGFQLPDVLPIVSLGALGQYVGVLAFDGLSAVLVYRVTAAQDARAAEPAPAVPAPSLPPWARGYGSAATRAGFAAAAIAVAALGHLLLLLINLGALTLEGVPPGFGTASVGVAAGVAGVVAGLAAFVAAPVAVPM